MFLTRCHKHLFQQVTRGTAPRCFAYTSRSFSSSSNRVLRHPTISSPRAALWTPCRFQPIRSNSTSTSSPNSSFTPRFDEEGNDSYLVRLPHSQPRHPLNLFHRATQLPTPSSPASSRPGLVLHPTSSPQAGPAPGRTGHTS